MDILSIITKKKNNKELSQEDINYFVYEYTIKRSIPDYQASALLMALAINGMSTYETYYLTKAFVDYSKHYDFKTGFDNQILVDKHSSGGIGDKITIILCPLLSCFNIRTIKISGRGLGHTGGTIDKLDSIKMDTNLDLKKYHLYAKSSNCLIMQQNQDLVPSDQMIYALRDVTATVDSYGLIAASILSKKFIINSDYIFIDLKVGSGALMTTNKKAIKLAKLMVDVAHLMNRNIEINITNMDQALGRSIGNLIEINEAYDFLQAKNQSSDIKELIYNFVAEILIKADICSSNHEAFKKIDEVINNQQAIKAFEKWLASQKASYHKNLFKPKYQYEIKAKNAGYIQYLDAKTLGLVALELGAGRKQKSDKIDFQAGIYLNKKTNEEVKVNETIATLYSSKKIDAPIIEKFNSNFIINKKPCKLNKLIVKTI